MTTPQQPPFGPPVPPAPPVPPKKGMSIGARIGAGCGGCLGLLLILFMFAGCVSALSGDASPTEGSDAGTRQEVVETEEDVPGDGEAQEEPVEEESEPEPEPEPEPEVSGTVGNGVHRVGHDIEPGTYSTGGPDPDGIIPMCYYARLSGLSGEFDDIISNNNIEGPGTVVVDGGDAALELSGGCEWTLQ